MSPDLISVGAGPAPAPWGLKGMHLLAHVRIYTYRHIDKAHGQNDNYKNRPCPLTSLLCTFFVFLGST